MARLLTTSIIAGLIVAVSACTNPDHGFKKHPTGFLYKLIEMNPKGQTPQTGDILVLSMRISNREGKVYDQSNFYRLQLRNPMFQGDFFAALAILQVGDSASFRMDASGFFEKNRKRDLPVEFKPGDPVYIDVRLKNILSREDLENEKESTFHTDFEQEMNLLKNFLQLTNTQVKPSETGLYYVEKKSGTGRKAEPGMTLTVHYTGKTIDGRIFDSSVQRGKPLTFVLGKGQVIKGWEEGFNLMKEGGEARFIIPSTLAYGKEGYSNIILPYSTLVFDVELIQVKQ